MYYAGPNGAHVTPELFSRRELLRFPQKKLSRVGEIVRRRGLCRDTVYDVEALDFRLHATPEKASYVRRANPSGTSVLIFRRHLIVPADTNRNKRVQPPLIHEHAARKLTHRFRQPIGRYRTGKHVGVDLRTLRKVTIRCQPEFH